MFNFFKKNDKLDIKSLIKKANNNDKESQRQLGLAYHRGTGVTKNPTKASYWLNRADNNN